MRRRRGKRFLIWTSVLLGIGVLALALLPVWLPWILRPIANHYGVFYASYRRVSYSRFALGELTFTNQNIRVRAERFESLVPTTWLFRLKWDGGQRFIAGENWELVTQPKTSTASRRERSLHANVRQIQNVVARVQQWIPSAAL